MNKTDANLIDRAIERARNYRMTPAEVFEQRVSFVYAQMNGAVTKDQVRERLRAMQGSPATHDTGGGG